MYQTTMYDVRCTRTNKYIVLCTSTCTSINTLELEQSSSYLVNAHCRLCVAPLYVCVTIHRTSSRYYRGTLYMYNIVPWSDYYRYVHRVHRILCRQYDVLCTRYLVGLLCTCMLCAYIQVYYIYTKCSYAAALCHCVQKCTHMEEIGCRLWSTICTHLVHIQCSILYCMYKYIVP